ncbi:hypothetical protein PMAYCL1PPCAC_03200 [Pristionchus mayeri]|uniref:Uncharacterized protein n=1 Tax=Pristionchus mayeri TaxID=1317129 RepID=A0AAN5C6Z6_9BILA|nr:hypothetical protein PMAYCL1PPCAC_03200 [Pristionchus mayeri]
MFAQVETSRLSAEERLAMVRNARQEEENEQIERAKYEARVAFAEAVTSVKRAVSKTDSV